jgi:N6-L-threonylcarbamoyladenine synthase
MKLLAIETSCDDTCAAVIDDARVLSNLVSSQAAFHEAYGGVVPEVASRHHLELVNAVVAAALDAAGTELEEVDAIAVTQGPGLIGALLVGLSTAKALAAPHRKPLIPVDHLQGHVAANYLEPDPLDPPFLCLIASGGHTLLAGVREHGSFEFPVAMEGPGLDFSFSGVKTALVYRVRDLGPERTKEATADLAASYQRAIVAQLAGKLERAAGDGEWPALALGGGVAANSELRARAEEICAQRGLRLKLVPIDLCTDNAAMIGSAARFVEPIPYPDYLSFDAFSTGEAVQPA